MMTIMPTVCIIWALGLIAGSPAGAAWAIKPAIENNVIGTRAAKSREEPHFGKHNLPGFLLVPPPAFPQFAGMAVVAIRNAGMEEQPVPPVFPLPFRVGMADIPVCFPS
ncbi:MAG: hypothetical protein WCS99_00190 [Limisphaerales bacterium]